MFRRAYLASLVALQCAIVVHGAPPLVARLTRPVAYAAVHGGAAGTLLLVLVALTALGAAVALSFPVLALARHLRRGAWRFVGVPPAAAVAAIVGRGRAGRRRRGARCSPGRCRPSGERLRSTAAAWPARPGFALTAAGALAGELLRRSIGPLWLPALRGRGEPGAALRRRAEARRPARWPRPEAPRRARRLDAPGPLR